MFRSAFNERNEELQGERYCQGPYLLHHGIFSIPIPSYSKVPKGSTRFSLVIARMNYIMTVVYCERGDGTWTSIVIVLKEQCFRLTKQ